MSLKMECQKNGMSLKLQYTSKWNVTKIAIYLKMDCHFKWSVTINGISPKM